MKFKIDYPDKSANSQVVSEEKNMNSNQSNLFDLIALVVTVVLIQPPCAFQKFMLK